MSGPTDNVTLLSEFMQLAPVIAGGVLAMLGGVGTQLFNSWLNGKRERRSLRREKCEELMQALYDHHHWLVRHNNATVMEDNGARPAREHRCGTPAR